MADENPGEEPSQEPKRGRGAPPAPPAPALLKRDETPLMEYLRRRLEMMEQELVVERERARSAEGAIRQQESLRSEVEGQLKAIAEQIRQQKTVQDLEEQKLLSRGRIELLEKRLDEMHQTWAALLKDAVVRNQGSFEAASSEIRQVTGALEALRSEFARVKEGVAEVTGMAPDLRGIQELVPSLAKGRSEDERALREQIREMLLRFGEEVGLRLKEMEARLSRESELQRERLSRLDRERETLDETLQEQRRLAREEALQDRESIERQLQEQLEGMRRAVDGVAQGQGGLAGSAEQLKTLSESIHAILTRPAKAKEEMLVELEGEKSDLLRALKERTEQLRAYTLERREVERSLGESLMDLNRQLDVERASHQETKSQISSHQLAADALRAEREMLQQQLSHQEDRWRKLAAERDALVLSLVSETEKVRRQIEGRMESDRAWEAKLIEHQKLLNDERDAKLKAEQAACDLRSQQQTITDHVTRVLREKEAVEKGFEAWQKEKEELLAALRKKDEMVGMLSSTFRNLLKKEGP